MIKFYNKNLVNILLILTISIINYTQSNPLNYTNDILNAAKATQIKAYLNTKIEKCNNFYEFACGKWSKLHPATVKMPKTSNLGRLNELFVTNSVSMLQNINRNDPVVDYTMRKLFITCRDVAAIEKLGLKPILEVAQMEGGWPKVNSLSWYEYEYDWLHTIAELRRKLGIDILIGLDIVHDYEDKDMHRIKIGAPNLYLRTRDGYLSDRYDNERDNYRDHIEQKLRQLFPHMPARWAEEVAQQVLSVERDLAKGLPHNSKLTLPQMTRHRNAAELKAAYGSYVDLNRYLNLVFNQTIYVHVYETPEDYFSNLVEVIKQTPKLTIANYTMWRVLDAFHIPENVSLTHTENFCVQKVREYFSDALEHMFFTHNSKVSHDILSVWARIKKSFRDQLDTDDQLKWMSSDTRERAISKLDSMQLKIMAHQNEDFKLQLKNLEWWASDYYVLLMNIMQWASEQKLAKLIQKPELKEIVPEMPTYEPTMNKILVPVTFLQSKFMWDTAYPESSFYGTIGFVLAHQMVRGFDRVGRKYDKEGHQRSWWDTVSEAAFDQRAHCFALQYSEYDTFQGIQVADHNAVMTAIADNVALSITYNAFKNLIASQRTPKIYPYLPFNATQLFFVEFAQTWCADYHWTSHQKFSTLPEAIRVNAALRNSNDFAEQFKCDNRSAMVSSKKCILF